jgi:nitrate reductase gamma subunit
LLTPFFLLGHITLLGLPTWWPVLSPELADVLTVATILAIGVLIGLRVSTKASRALSRFQDLALLVILFAAVGFGFAAANPGFSPFAARSMLLLHILAANLVLILSPFSKIAHCVLYPMLQLVFQLGWHFPAQTGRHVAVALHKENEPI